MNIFKHKIKLDKELSNSLEDRLGNNFDGDYLISLCNILINRYKNLKLLNKSIDLLIYQFEGFDKYLLENFGETKRDTFRAELKGILKQKKELFENLK